MAAGKVVSVTTTLDPIQQNAYDTIRDILSQWGLGSLAPTVLDWVRKGYGQDTINYELQQQPAYQQRFYGNVLRQKAGLSVLSPGDYIATESAYRQVLRGAGLPSSFYSTPAELANLIGSDLSPSEVQQRAQEASAFVQSTDPNLKAALYKYHGIDSAHLVAHYLDPKTATSILARQSAEAQMGAAALDQGLGLSDLKRVDSYLDQGFNPNSAQQAYSTVGNELPTLRTLGDIYKQPFAQGDEEDAVIGGLASAQRKRQGLIQNEADAFSGSGGGTADTLSTPTTGTY